MVEICRKVAGAAWFSNLITVIILFAGVLVGVETYPAMVADYGSGLQFLNRVILGVFAAEVVVKVVAESPKPWNYFRDPWNIFDFLIVATAFMPVDAQFVTVLRLARLLRVLKLVRALPKLQILVSALLKSIPSMGYVSLLLMLLFYLFAVTATFIFSANDPVHFENLQISMLSLFRVVTLEDWTDVMYIQMYGCAQYGYSGIEQLCTQSQGHPVFGAIFFVTFVLLGTMIVLNLFVGVIMSGMDEAGREQHAARQLEAMQSGTVSGELQAVNAQLAQLQAAIERMGLRVDAEANANGGGAAP